MSFGLQNFNNSGSFNGSISSVSGPTPVVNPVTVMPGLTGSIGSSNTVTGITNANTGNIGSGGNTGSITGSSNTGTINSGSGATQISRVEVERAMSGTSGQGSTQPAATTSVQSFWDKYKVWAIPGAAFIVILVAMYYFMRAKK